MTVQDTRRIRRATVESVPGSVWVEMRQVVVEWSDGEVENFTQIDTDAVGQVAPDEFVGLTRSRAEDMIRRKARAGGKA